MTDLFNANITPGAEPTFQEKLVAWKNERMASIKGWGDFTDRSKFSKPPMSPTDLASRVSTNLQEFQGNYLVVMLILAAYCVITQPMLMLLFAAIFAAYFYAKNSANLAIAGNPVPRRVLDGAFLLLVGVAVWLTSAFNTVFWLIGATITIVGLHSLLYTADAMPLPAPI